MIDQATFDTDRHAELFLDLLNVCVFLMQGSSKESGESSKVASQEGLILSSVFIVVIKNMDFLSIN